MRIIIATVFLVPKGGVEQKQFQQSGGGRKGDPHHFEAKNYQAGQGIEVKEWTEARPGHSGVPRLGRKITRREDTAGTAFWT